ncbi:MAG: hypothetical protein SGJ00_06355 [bacterium]|nr:hypothetical protein [bacterium]
MKKLILNLFLCVNVLLAVAQLPEPILSFATYVKPCSYYKQQATLWKTETEKDKNNAYAWFNFYRATRNLVRTDTTDHRSQELKVKQQGDIIDEMEKAVPNSFDYHLAKWMHNGQNFDYIKHLQKAGELGQNRTEHLSDMAGWGEIEGNREKRNKYCKIWLEKGLVSPGLMYYNYNTLVGLKQNAIILTFGDNDTYPLWLLQSKGIRTDVTVINAYLFLIDDYRNRVMKELGTNYKPFIFKDTLNLSQEYDWFRTDLVKTLATNKKGCPVNLVIGCDESYSKPIEADLYLCGLSYEYSKSTLDNMAMLKKNFEQVYALDYLDKVFYKDISAEIVERSNLNYIVPMIKLYDHYLLSGEQQKAFTLRDKLLHICAGMPEEVSIKAYLNQ